jgi:hypothetical protein
MLVVIDFSVGVATTVSFSAVRAPNTLLPLEFSELAMAQFAPE